MTDSQARPDPPISELASDRPIESQTQDRLGSAPFADNLFIYLGATKKSPKLLPDVKVEFRNKVTNRGVIEVWKEAELYRLNPRR